MDTGNLMVGNINKENNVINTQIEKKEQDNIQYPDNTFMQIPIHNPEEQKKKEKEEAAQKQRQALNEEAWKNIREYRKTGVDVSRGDYDKDWDSFNLEELMAILEERSNTKSKSFHVMKNELNNLLNLAKTSGLKEKAQNNNAPADLSQYEDFQEAFYRAKTATANFVFKHNSILNVFQAEKNTRYQAAVRIDRLLDDMQREVKIAQAALLAKINTEKKDETPEEKRQKRIDLLIKTGEASADEKVNPEWIDRDYQEKLSLLIQGKTDLVTDEDFLKFITDKKNILTARKMAIVIFCEENSEKTLGIPMLSDELKSFIEEAMKDDSLMYEGEFNDFKAKIENVANSFLKDNEDRLQMIEHRQEIIKMALDAENIKDELFKNSEISEMLLNDSEEEFNEEILNLNKAMLQNDALIENLVSERISIVNRKDITEKIKTMLGTARILSGVNDIIDLTGAALDVILFSCQEEALFEQRINIIMSQSGVASTYKDAFSLFYQNNAGKIDEVSIAKKFLLQMKNGEKITADLVKNKRLTEEAFKKIDRLLNYSGALDTKEFTTRLNEIISNDKKEQGTKTFSRKEYILGKEKAPSKNYSARSKARLRGELFLESKEIKSVLSADDIAFLQKNLTSIVLAHLTGTEGATSLTVLDNIAPRQLRMLANILKKDILANAGRLKDVDSGIRKNMLVRVAKGEIISDEAFQNILQNETKIFTESSEKAKRRLLAYLGDDLSNIFKLKGELKDTEGLSEKDKERVLKENFDKFGVHDKQELLGFIKSHDFSDERIKEESKGLSEQLKRQKKYLKDTYKDKRYRMVLDYLVEIPEVLDAMLATDEGSFVSFCRNVLDEKLKDFIVSLDKIPETEAHKKAYLDQNFVNIYLGEKTSTDWERDISDFCQSDFTKKEYYAEDTRWDRLWKWAYQKFGWEVKKFSKEDNIEKAKSKILNKIWKIYGREARFGMLDKAFVYWNKLMNSEKDEDQEVFSSASELARVGFIGIENHEINQKTALSYITVRINQNPELKSYIKADDEKNGEKNLGLFQAQFASFVSNDAILMDNESFQGKLEKIADEFIVYYKAVQESVKTSTRSEKELEEYNKANEEIIKKIEEKKEKGRGIKDKFLRVNSSVIADAIEGKTLIGDADEMVIRKGRKEYEWQRLADFEDRNLPDIVKSCVVERSISYHLKDSDFAKHLSHLDYIYKNISEHLDKKEEKLSDDEKDLFTVFLYNQADNLPFFKVDKLPDLEQITKMPLFTEFRDNYKVLKNFEELETKDFGAKQEKSFMTRNLRILLTKGAGLIDKDNKAFDLKQRASENTNIDSVASEYGALFRETAQKHIDYLKYKNEAYAVISEKLKSWKPLSDYAYERYLYALREYYQYDIVKDCHDKKAFSLQDWEKRISDDLKDESLMKYMRGRDGENIGLSEEFERESSLDDGYTMEDIERLIDEKTFMPGMNKKFRALDDEQKRLFVLALMMMNKSSIGRGINGTTEVLQSSNAKNEKLNEAQKALEDYLQGKKMRIALDYHDAMSKLLNVGEFYFISSMAVLSTSAFDDAYKFAEEMKLQRIYNSDRDLKRVGDGMTSVMEAARIFGKPQAEIVKKFSNRINTLSDVKNELFDMAKKENATDIAGHIGNMNERDLRLFIKILQNRTILDKSVISKNGHRVFVNAEDRENLIDALVGEETRSAELADMASPESCFKALATAYSFQMRDDIVRKDTHLTKEHFVKNSINRTTLIDWDLLKKAYNLMVEVKNKQVQAHMLRHASDHIEESGNQEAINEYRKLKERQGADKSTTLEQFENYILKNAQSDELKRVVAGYLSFTDAQKKLFIKALGRRDILDISKKNYYKNFLMGVERDYVNKADRYALIDEFISGTKQGNSGVVLKKGAHYDALCSLFSTQMSDTDGIEAYGGSKEKMSAERLLFAQRTTAIDWKLFTRAVSFVNRASKELEYAEGNEELYRSAGKISENGEMQMDYSLLRKNYHRTGNGNMRFITRNVIKRFDSNYKVSQNLGYLLLGAKYMDSYVLSYGLDEQRKKAEEISKNFKELNNSSDIKISKVKLLEPKKEKKEPVGDFEIVKANIDKIVDGKKSVDKVISEIVENIKIYGYFPQKGKKSTNTEKDFVSKSKVPEGIKKLEFSYGDIRDYKYISDTAYYVVKYAYDYGYNKIISTYGAMVLKDKKVQNYLKEGNTYGAISETEKFLKSRFEEKFKDIFGEEEAKRIVKSSNEYGKKAKSMGDTIDLAIRRYKYADGCMKNINSIIKAKSNYSSLNVALDKSGEKKAGDEQKLEDARKYQTDAQKEQNKKTVENQEKLMKLGVDLSKIENASQISASVLNIIIDTINMNDIVISGGAKVISETISGAVELCLYITTLAFDKKKMADYFRNSEDGKETVKRLFEGLKKVYAKEPEKYNEAKNAYSDGTMSDGTLLELIRDGLGYQNNDELVADTCMKVAQNVVFCASKYNPMESNKVIAKAVMSALGLAETIGNTSPEAAEKLYKKMNKAK